MKAIILASGIGKRLKPLTDETPKPLISVGKKSIIEVILDALKKYKIKDIVITTGPFEEKFQYFLMEKYSDLDLKFVFNPQYDTTNYIYSLWLTKDYIDDDIFLLHGDLVFDDKLIGKMIKSKDKNLVLVNKKAKPPEKDFKAVIKDGKVEKIGVNFFTDNSFLSMPLYKLSREDFLLWMEEIETEVKSGKLARYAEDAFNKISDQIELKPLYFEKELCMEIDTKEDLEKAKKKIKF
jgi:phosphoenolpyruvate phosphomutase